MACITDEMILNMADEGIFAFEEYFGRATESELQPVPLWRANWSDQDSLNLVRSMLNKPWFIGMEDAGSLNLTSLRNNLRLSPLRIYRPGAEPGTEPVYNVSTIMSALDVPDPSDDKKSAWTESVVEDFAWDILQGGFDFFSSLKNLVVSENTPSIFIPLLNSPVVAEAWLKEDSEVRNYAIRSSEGNSANVLNIILREFNITYEDMVQRGVAMDAFQGTVFASGTRQRRNMINHLLQNNRLKKMVPMSFLTSIYTVHGVHPSYIGDSNISAVASLRNMYIEEFQRAYARQRQLILTLLSRYSRQGKEYALGLLSVGDGVGDPLDWECFDDRVFVEATLEGRRFDGNARRWPGYLLDNRPAYIERLLDCRESMVGVMTEQELKDLMLNVNYNVEFGRKLIVPMYGELYEQILDDFGGDVEEAEAASIIMMRSQLDGLVGEVLADNFLDTLPTELGSRDFTFLQDILGPEDWLNLDEFIDDSATTGPVRTSPDE